MKKYRPTVIFEADYEDRIADAARIVRVKAQEFMRSSVVAAVDQVLSGGGKHTYMTQGDSLVCKKMIKELQLIRDRVNELIDLAEAVTHVEESTYHGDTAADAQQKEAKFDRIGREMEEISRRARAGFEGGSGDIGDTAQNVERTTAAKKKKLR